MTKQLILWILQWGIYIVSIFSFMETYSIRRTLSYLKIYITDYNSSQLANMEALLLIGYTVFQFIIPTLLDRVQPLIIITLLVTAVMVSKKVIGYYSSLYGINAVYSAYFLQGVGQSALLPLWLKIINILFYDKKYLPRLIGVWSCIHYTVGYLVLLNLKNTKSLKQNWRSYLLVQKPHFFTILGLAITAIAYNICLKQKFYNFKSVVQKNQKDYEPLQSDDLEVETKNLTYMETLRKLISNNCVILSAFAYLNMKFIRTVLLHWFTVLIKDIYSLDQQVSLTHSQIFEIGSTAGGIIGVFTLEFIAKKRFFYILGFLVAMSCIVIAIMTVCLCTHSLVGFYILLVCTFAYALLISLTDLIMSCYAPTQLSTLGHYGVKHIGITSGIINGFGSIGTVIQSFTVFSLATKIGWMPVMAIMTLIQFSTVFLFRPLISSEKKLLTRKI